jgi:hypothetical protein
MYSSYPLTNSYIDDFAPINTTLNPYKECANLHQRLIILPTYDKLEQMQPHISGQYNLSCMNMMQSFCLEATPQSQFFRDLYSSLQRQPSS